MNTEQMAKKQTYLVVPYEERNQAVKAAGKLQDGNNALHFDEKNKLWYAKEGADLSKIKQWLPDASKANSTTSEKDPVVEFSEALKDAGFELNDLPEMDGKRHRVKTREDKKGQKTGVYVGYLDGIPAGWYQDHRAHSEPVKWKATGQKLDKTAQDHLKAIAVQRSIEREAKQNQSYDHNAHRAEQAYNLMPDATQEQGYLSSKGVQAFPGAKIDKKGRLVLPLKNENGEIRTLQRIDSNGFKMLKKNGQKTGNYHVVGDRELQNGEPILYAEGYSTSASIAEATNRPVVMTVDAGNLPRVAEKLKAKYPDSPHIILGDDDRNREVNKGREKAEEAAAITGGVYRVPAFNYQEQKDGLSDFNDLHHSRGLQPVRDQVEQIISQATKAETRGETNMTAETTNEPHAKNTNEPVVTEQFEQYVNKGLSAQTQVHDQTVDKTTEPAKEAPAQPENAPVAAPTQQVGQTVDKTTEPAKEAPAQPENAPVAAPTQQVGQTVDKTTEPAKEAPAQPENAPVAAPTQQVGQTVDKTTEPAKEAPAQPENAPVAAPTQQVDQTVDNSVEPYVEQKQEKETDSDAKRWLKNRESLEGILAQEETRDQQRRQQLGQMEQPQPRPMPSQSQEADPFAELETGFKPVVPEKVTKSYVEVDGKYYFAGRPDSLAFVDKGAKLQTKLSSANVAASMVDIAEARGWTELQVKGTEDFRREAWLEAASRGLEVRGYKPKEEDLARLKALSDKRQINEIEAREQADQPRSGNVSTGDKVKTQTAIKEAGHAQTEQAEQVKNLENNRASDEKADVNRLAGTIVEHGKAPYEHNPDNRNSYYVTLENSDGQKTTTWGIGLEKAVKESEVKTGDQVELENKGRKPVTVSKEIKDENGKVVETQEINTHRNEWEIKAQAIRDKSRDARDVVKEHPDLVNEVAAVKVAEKFSQQKFASEEDRNRFMDKVRSQIASNVASGQDSPEIKVREERELQRANKEHENER